MCGTEAVTLEDATKLAELLRKTQIVPASEKDGHSPAGLRFFYSLDGFRSNLAGSSAGEMVMLLSMTRSLECAQIVDRVYGVLGMLPDRYRDNITVDYTCGTTSHPEALFTQVGKLMLEERGALNRFVLLWILSRPRMPHTPSWLPGYMYGLDGRALVMGRAGLPQDTTSSYCQSHILTSLSASFESFAHPDNIKIRGMLVDEVIEVVHQDWQSSYRNGKEEDDMKLRVQHASEFLKIEARCAALAAKVGIVPHSTSTTYCRTLVADREFSNIPGPRPYNIDNICEDYRDAIKYLYLTQDGAGKQVLHPNRLGILRFLYSLSNRWRGGRSFFTTAGGKIGIGGFDSELRAGDNICIFFGAEQLFNLRKTEQGGVYSMVGDAYVYGLMDCEAFDMKDPSRHAQTFEIC